MTTSLPENPSLENLKKQAKSIQKAWQAGGVETLARIRAAHPQYGGLSEEQLRAAKPRLTDCQLVPAREAGFDNWPQLKIAIKTANGELQHQFVDIACLCHDDPHYALERPFAECLSRKAKPEDWQTPLARMAMRVKTEAIRVLLKHGADAGARHPDGKSLIEAVRGEGFEEIARLLEAAAG